MNSAPSHSWNSAVSINYFPTYWYDDEELVTRLTRAMADVQGIPPEDVDPDWSGGVDIEAVEQLFDGATESNASLVLRSAAYEVRIQSDLSIVIAERTADR